MEWQLVCLHYQAIDNHLNDNMLDNTKKNDKKQHSNVPQTL